MDTIADCARRLRRQMTEEEQRLWYLLRSLRFAGHKFRRQHPLGSYIVDFACCRARLAVELDGGQHMDNEAYDRRRTAWLKQRGWRVLRFWNNELRENGEGVLGEILRALEGV